MKKITILENFADPLDLETVEVEDVCEFLAKRFASFPMTARIYHGTPSAATDVTPATDAMIEHLQTLPGPFAVVVYPEYEAIPYIIIAIIAAIVAVALTPTATAPILPNSTTPSPNNDLSARQNSARPFQRIPDIYGTVRSVPDLVMLPYNVFVANKAYEHAYMCIGRGHFDVMDCRDDTTPISSIPGAGVTVYPPSYSPNTTITGGLPDGMVTFGESNADVVRNMARCTSVNGQDLLSTTAGSGSILNAGHDMARTIQPWYTGAIHTTGMDLSTLGASVGDELIFTFQGLATLGGDVDMGSPGAITVWAAASPIIYGSQRHLLNGVYPILAIDVAGGIITVDTSSNQAAWDRIKPSNVYAAAYTYDHYTLFDGTQAFTPYYPPNDITIASTMQARSVGDSTVGPFVFMQPAQTEVWLNLVATNGLYQINGSGTVTSVTVDLLATVQRLDSNGAVVGTPTSFTHSIVGDSSKETIAQTWKITLPVAGPCSITLSRTSPSPENTQVMDSIKWKDLYSMTPVSDADFGDVTTVYSVTKATQGALSVKERKLNLLVQRKVPAYLGGTSFGALTGTNNFADILCAIALDPAIGNRSVSELDVAGFHATAAAMSTYFGTPFAQEFCYTFDSNNMSFEEIVSTVCGVVFCTPYRQGSLLRVSFEQLTSNSLMLFGHRNKMPGTEQRSVAFGPTNDYDSVQIDYISPTDDAKVTLYIPSQGINPNKITANGCRNYAQAYLLGWRAWNRLKYQNTSVEFTALQEAALVKRNDRVLVADGTRSGAQDGEVLGQTVLELQLSQPVVFAPGKSYTIFLQGIDESVESIAITPGSTAYHVVLAHAPTVTLSLDENASVRALYWIVPTNDTRPQAFLVTKREPGDTSFTQKVTAINYDARYYANDGDFPVGGSIGDPDRGVTIIPVGGGTG